MDAHFSGAQTNGWSLEELELFLEIGIDKEEGTMDTVIDGVVLESAQWSSDGTPTGTSKADWLLLSPLFTVSFLHALPLPVSTYLYMSLPLFA